jgi:hypothetical protein
MSDAVDETRPDADAVRPEQVRVVRLGHGANCSSVGSVIDTLFATAVVGGAIFAALAAALGQEKVTVVGTKDEGAKPAPAEKDDAP